MAIEIGLIPGTIEANINTHYAPLALLSSHYQQKQILKPLEMVDVAMKTVRYSPTSKLEQVFLSILAGCEYLSEVNCRLKSEQALAQVWQLERFADQRMIMTTSFSISRTPSSRRMWANRLDSNIRSFLGKPVIITLSGGI